jgi:hypothetical protein
MAFPVPTICSKCKKAPRPKGGVIRMHLDPPVCEDCKPFPREPRTVEVPRSAWNALVRFLRKEERVYRDSYNTPGKNDWEETLKNDHPHDYAVYLAAKKAADLKV